MKKNKMVRVALRLESDVMDRLKNLVAPGCSIYKTMHDIMVAGVYGGNSVQNNAVLKELNKIVAQTGYSSTDALMVDLAKAFLKVWQYNNNQLDDDEPTPSEEIRDMFDNMSDGSIINDCDEKGYSIGRRI